MYQDLVKIAEWLKSCECYDIKPCYVKLGKTVLSACEYKQDRLSHPDKSYTIHAFYCVGRMPRMGKVYYKYNGDIWYIGAHYQENNPKYDEFHPFGHNFMLFPSNGMDILDKSPDRVNMSVEYL